MTWLRNAWYQAGWSDELGAGAFLARTILEAPLLFFRRVDGSIAAIHDRCPHRFAPLSAGTLRDGVVTCGYHGLAFDGTGKCVRNPHGPIASAMRVPSFPAAERHQALWVWMGDAERADPSTIPDLSFIDETPEPARIKGYLPTRANYQLLTDNILDLSHTDYLHPTTLGGIMTGAKAKVRDDGDTLHVEWFSGACEPPAAFKPIVPTGRADIWTEVAWQAPAVMVLNTGAIPAGAPRTRNDESFTLHNMVPETKTTTHYFYCNTRRFKVDDAGFSAYLRGALEQAFVAEDKPMLESQQARMGTDDLWSLRPLLLGVDAGAVQARRKLEKKIAEEGGR